MHEYIIKAPLVWKAAARAESITHVQSPVSDNTDLPIKSSELKQ